MMRLTMLAFTCSLLALSGCGTSDKTASGGGSGAGGNGAAPAAGAPQSAADVAGQAAQVRLKPGQWESTFEIADLTMAGLPQGVPQDAMKDQMKAAMSKRAIRHCVTPEEAAKPDGSLFANQDRNCTYTGFDMSGGMVKGNVRCDREGTITNASMTGHYAPERYDMVMDMTMAGGPRGMTMTMKAKSAGKWVGAQCAAGSE
ncbi:DUF3617 domain-containing protein [Sphingobium aquiterrae]|uniref:DUF3617 domain-containing protein n=1 Tax=Sphingobium aquiterrae TaxID=2038656 RepID=UPI003017B463